MSTLEKQLNLDFKATIGVKGRFHIELRDKDGKKKKEIEFDNLLLDSFFTLLQNRFNSTTTPGIQDFRSRSKYCKVGTGTAAPAATQTGLQALLATSPFVTTSLSFPAPYVLDSVYCQDFQMVFTFDLGAVVGNLTEIGIAVEPQTGSETFCRALIVDGGGTPTTLTVTADDQLIVTYTLTLKGVDAAGSGTVVLNGVTYNWTSNRFAMASITAIQMLCVTTNSTVNSYQSTSVFGAFNVVPTLSSGTAGSLVTPLGTVPGEVRYGFTATISQMNATGGIKCISIGPSKFSFTPVLPKDSTKTLSMTFSHQFTRIP